MMPLDESGAATRANEVIRRLPDGPILGAEVGVYLGHMSARLLAHHDLFLYMVDSWRGAEGQPEHYRETGDWSATASADEQDEAFQEARARTMPYESRRMILRMDSLDAADLVADRSLDFVFIDADHSYEGARRDIAAWEPKVKLGGLLCGHDYDTAQHPGVKRAVDEFAAFIGFRIQRGQNATWFVRLP